MQMMLRMLALGSSATVAMAQNPTVEQQSSGTKVRLQAVWAVSSKVAWASGAGATFTVTTDGGTTWRAGVVPGADSLEFRDVHAFDDNVRRIVASHPVNGKHETVRHSA